VDANRRQLAQLLRPDSGTARADSSFFAWKRRYDTVVDAAGRRLQTETIQCLIDPGGATAQRLHGDRCAFSVSPQAPAVAESLRALLERHGVHGDDGEGDMYYTAGAATLRRVAGPFLTKPAQELLDLWVIEDRTPAGGDGALSVSWQELTRRLAITDRLVTNGGSVALASVGWFGSYLAALFGNWDNSSGFTYGNPRVFRDADRQRVENYATQHPTTRGGVIAAEYLALLRANRWRRTDAVEAFLSGLSHRVERP
jgi:hypothetical protein